MPPSKKPKKDPSKASRKGIPNYNAQENAACFRAACEASERAQTQTGLDLAQQCTLRWRTVLASTR